MCFGGQPAAPINKPSYSPEESDQHFDVTMRDADGKETILRKPKPVRQATP